MRADASERRPGCPQGDLSSDYEGNRHIQDVYPFDSVEQVRRLHAMFERLIGDIAGGKSP